MNVHKNARLTSHGRERIVKMVLSGQTPQAVAKSPCRIAAKPARREPHFRVADRRTVLPEGRRGWVGALERGPGSPRRFPLASFQPN